MAQEHRNKQMKRLRNRGELSPQTRANTDYKMAKKLRSKLNSLNELELILDKIPKEKLSDNEYKYVTDNHVFTLLKLAEKIMSILEFKKIRGIEEYLYVIREKNRRKEPTYAWNPNYPKYIIKGIPFRDAPNEKDIKRSIKLSEHSYTLEAFLDSDVPIPGYEKPNHYPIIDDWYDAVIQANEDVKISSKIKELLDSGTSDIKQIAKEVGCQTMQVENAIESRRRSKELKEAKDRLEKDSTATQMIKEFWVNTFNRDEIAKAIGYPRDVVCSVIEQMMANGEIPKDLVIVPGGGFPNNPRTEKKD
ncbi:Uncharacterised protein [uncultured archaeon]|nr:Uncharacterised protein [uncultured archaeon]